MEEYELGLKVNVVGEYNSDELHNLLLRDFLTKAELDSYEYVNINMVDNELNGNLYLDGRPISIINLKKTIERIENDGGNYVMLEYHDDHDEYEFTGLNISRVDEEYLNRAKEMEEAAETVKKLKQIEELEKLIEKIKSEI